MDAKDNRVTLLPAAGGAGKTALLGYMVQEFRSRHMGDDIVILGKAGNCLSFPRSFVLKEYHRSIYPEVFQRLNLRTKSSYKVKRFLIDNAPFLGIAKTILRRRRIYYKVAQSINLIPHLAEVPVEEIFGEIEDEHDTSDLVEKQLDKNRYLLSGRHEIDYLNEKYRLDIPKKDDYETIAGLILTRYESIPKLNDRITIDDFTFQILKSPEEGFEHTCGSARSWNETDHMKIRAILPENLPVVLFIPVSQTDDALSGSGGHENIGGWKIRFEVFNLSVDIVDPDSFLQDLLKVFLSEHGEAFFL